MMIPWAEIPAPCCTSMLDMSTMFISRWRGAECGEEQPADNRNYQHHRPRELANDTHLSARNPQTSDKAKTEALACNQQRHTKLPVCEHEIDEWSVAYHLTRRSSATAGGSELCCGV